MNSKEKLIYLPYAYSKDLIDNINSYFNIGYIIGDILNADNGYYILLTKDNENYEYKYINKLKLSDNNSCLIEENNEYLPKWTTTSTDDIIFDSNDNKNNNLIN